MSNFKLNYNPSCPIDIFNNPNLNNNEKMIFMVITNIIGAKEKKCTLTNEDIASASNTSLKTVVRALNKLFELELIWLDVNRKRVVNNPNEAVRHIYTNYKYYCDRNKKQNINIPTFKSIHHFRNWAKAHAKGFEARITKEDGAITPIRINSKGYIENINLNKSYHPTDDKSIIYYIWNKLYENNEILTNYVKTKGENVTK